MKAIVTTRKLALGVALVVGAALLVACTPDTVPPSVPTGLTGTAASSTTVNLGWIASTDNVGVTGYKIFRDGQQIATSTKPSYRDTQVARSTTYTYAVSAYDGWGNNSAQSTTASVTTPPVPVTTSQLFVGDNAWGLLLNAGRWNGGNWKATIDSYLSARQAQGFTGVEISAMSWLEPTGRPNPWVYADGRDWDGVYPFNSTMNPSSGLNSTFWARRDYLVAQAASRGIDVVMNVTTPALGFDTTPVSPLRGWTSQQWSDYGTALGNRYKNDAHIMWILGDDYFGTLDAGFDAWLVALRATGDQHLVSVQNFTNSTSKTDIQSGDPIPWGTAHAQFDWVYTYDVTYDGIEKAYAHDGALPIIWGDGNGIGDMSLPVIRKMIWWALSSGARGFSIIDEDLWKFPANWHDLMTGTATDEATFWSTVIPAIATAYESLTDWNLLVPDTSSQLVTSGRGSHSPGNQQFYSWQDTDNYVTASRTPSGSLAVIFMSNPSTIKVDTSKLQAGYVARWMDPLTGTQYPATPTATNGATATYNSGGAQGGKGVDNSAGDPDWALVFRR